MAITDARAAVLANCSPRQVWVQVDAMVAHLEGPLSDAALLKGAVPDSPKLQSSE